MGPGPLATPPVLPPGGEQAACSKASVPLPIPSSRHAFAPVHGPGGGLVCLGAAWGLPGAGGVEGHSGATEFGERGHRAGREVVLVLDVATPKVMGWGRW